ncbi:MAG: hypothetical protein KIS63_05695 [Caldilineales bacterium]|nr:hypothetical protein [Caldilineales bacterium]
MSSLPNPLGPYRLDRRLGGGGADVYLAFDARRGQPGAYSEVRRFVFNRQQPDKPTPPPPSPL